MQITNEPLTLPSPRTTGRGDQGEGKILVFVNPHYWANPQENDELRMTSYELKKETKATRGEMTQLRRELELLKSELRTIKAKAPPSGTKAEIKEKGN